MHVATTRRQHKDKVYETHLLRRSYREDGKVKNETLANLSYLPPDTIQLIRESLAGKSHVIVGEGFELTRSLPHGHLAVVSVMANQLGLPDLLGPACKERDIAYALIVAPAAQARDHQVVARHHARKRPGARGRQHRRRLRRHGLAGHSPGVNRSHPR